MHFFANLLTAAFGEKISLKKLNMIDDFIHAYLLEGGGSIGIVVRQIAKWHKFRIINRSNKPVSIVGAYYKEGNCKSNDLPTPFVRHLEYDENLIHLKHHVNLPIRLESGDAIDIFILLPISINEEAGKRIVKLMLKNPIKIESLFDALIYCRNDSKIKKRIEKEILNGLSEEYLGQIYAFDNVDLGSIQTTRGFIKEKNGEVSYVDSESKAKDGFIFIDSLEAKIYLDKSEFEEIDSLNYRLAEPLNKKYSIIFETQGGKLFSFEMDFTDFAHLSEIL